MFVYFTKANGFRFFINVERLEMLQEYKFTFNDGYIDLTVEQYDEIVSQLITLKLVATPSEPLPPVGEPFRKIVGEAFQEFMNTKGRTD
jgi:hypothetical protein